MPFYLHQVSYTPEAMAKLIANPQDRTEAVRGPIEKLGGKIKDVYFAFGEHDVVLITEMPNNVSAAAICHGVCRRRRGPQQHHHSANDLSGGDGRHAHGRNLRVQGGDGPGYRRRALNGDSSHHF